GYRLKELRLVDAESRRVGGFDARVFARATNDKYITVPRSLLAQRLFQADRGVETRFGDEISIIESAEDHLRVGFESGETGAYDLVIGAGGLHSRVRTLCFGDEETFTDYLGYKVAAFVAQDYPRRDELVYVGYATPGQQAARFALKDGDTLVLLVMA